MLAALSLNSLSYAPALAPRLLDELMLRALACLSMRPWRTQIIS